MNKTLGEYGTFWFYMSWCIVGLVFVYFCLPETKGKPLDDIERMFANKKKQQLYAAQQANGTATAPDAFNIEPIPRVPIEPNTSHSNDAYDMDSDEEDNGEVVATPL